MIVCPNPENCQPYGEHYAHHQAGRVATCGERNGIEDICSLTKGHADEWHQDEGNRSRWLRAEPGRGAS